MIRIKKEKLIIMAGLIILIALLYNLFMTPQGKRLKAIRAQYISAKKLFRTREIKGGKLETLWDENRVWKSKLDAVEKRFITRGEVNLFLKSLTRLAEETWNKLETVDPLEKKLPVESGIESMLVEVTITGSYPSIIDFLNILAANEKLLDITDFEIERESSKTRNLRASFVLTLFIIEARSF